MKTTSKITIETTIKSDIDTVWKRWTTPSDIKKWNTASPEWHTTKAENNLKKGGHFSSRMEAKDGSMGFDFDGIYEDIIPNKHIAYVLDDNRKVDIKFETIETGIKITETFEPENQNPAEMQKQGWQAILDNFKTYVESK